MVLAESTADSTQLESPIHAGNGEYLMELSIGTPTLKYSAVLDTGSDLIWTQCKPCTQYYNQPTPIFDPAKSSTFSKLSCTATFAMLCLLQIAMMVANIYTHMVTIMSHKAFWPLRPSL